VRAAALALCALAAAAAGQDPAPAPPAPPPEGPAPAARPKAEEIVRLEAWPEIPKDQKKQVEVDIERLRKAHTEEMGVQARAALIADGAGIVPELLPKLGKEKDPAAVARIEEVLTAVTGAQHTRLLAASFADKSQPLRTFALLRVAEFPDAGTRAEAEAALARAAAVQDPGKEDQAEHLAAALAATASGSLLGLDHLAERAETGFGAHGKRMRTALEAVRGPEATQQLAPRLKGERAQKIAALNLLAGCGDPSAKALVKPHLDDSDNSVRIAAINALRGIVDGDPPLDQLPVFKAIELAKEWKARV
jgi:hypothetical protein